MAPLWLAIRLPDHSSPSDLACWAGQFTPRVSLAEDALLLDIGGCLRLFNGLNGLRQAVQQSLTEQGLMEQRFAESIQTVQRVTARTLVRIGIAPTPQAAIWLAEGQRGTDAGLDDLAIANISWPPGVAEKLARFGLCRLGELRRLPSAALARRIGQDAALRIARAYGDAPDPRRDFVFPLHFDETIELPAAVDAAPILMFPARRLVAALTGWLNVRQAGVRTCQFDLIHRQDTTPLLLRFAETTRNSQRIERVLRERLERLQLAAPVERLRLVVDSVEAMPGENLGLFETVAGKESMAALLERLRARLGEDRVLSIFPVAAYRPECATAWILQQPGIRHKGANTVLSGSSKPDKPPDSVMPPRPLWLLSKPKSLPEIGGQPHHGGPLTLLAGPERIESGWWDQDESGYAGKGVGDIRRDYFIALTQDQRWAWIFRERKAPGGWFLHGWFA